MFYNDCNKSSATKVEMTFVGTDGGAIVVLYGGGKRSTLSNLVTPLPSHMPASGIEPGPHWLKGSALSTEQTEQNYVERQ